MADETSPKRTVGQRCKALLKIVYGLFAAALLLAGLFWLMAVVGEIIYGPLFMLIFWLLCALVILSAAGVICGIAAAVRERKKRYLAMTAAFLPPAAVAALVVYAVLYAGSHY